MTAIRPAADKQGALMGMGMTEKQGGSDVRTNTTRAVPAGARGPGREYRLTGHKWFFSAPMCDAFLVLAQAPGGLSCFLRTALCCGPHPQHTALAAVEGQARQPCNASSEVEFEPLTGCSWERRGEVSRRYWKWVSTLGSTMRSASAGLMRQCVAQAIHHARQRSAFGHLLATSR